MTCLREEINELREAQEDDVHGCVEDDDWTVDRCKSCCESHGKRTAYKDVEEKLDERLYRVKQRFKDEFKDLEDEDNVTCVRDTCLEILGEEMG